MGFPIILIGEGNSSQVGWDNITLEFLQEETKKLMPSFKGNRHPALNLNWWKVEISKYLPSEEGSFILVYIGVLRDFIYECVKQIRLWNPVQTIYLCINNNEQNKPFVDSIKEFNITISYIEELPMTEDHKIFNQKYTNMGMNGFWKYTMERIFIVEECMRKHNLQNIFHLEIDNMVYFKVNEILLHCKSINKILIPSDSERRYIAGTIFVNNPNSLSKLNKYFTDFCANQDEMHSIMQFSRLSNEIETWPVLPPGDNIKLIYEDRRHLVNDVQRMSNHSALFKGVFDAAAVGQFLGGIDPIHDKNNTDGFVNKDSIFSIDRVWFRWEKVEGLQRVNISVDKVKWYPIYNLHIHNKNLKRWMSDIPEMTKHLPNIL